MMHLAATLEVMGSRPSLGDIFDEEYTIPAFDSTIKHRHIERQQTLY